jgi:hypothetical protein
VVNDGVECLTTRITATAATANNESRLQEIALRLVRQVDLSDTIPSHLDSNLFLLLLLLLLLLRFQIFTSICYQFLFNNTFLRIRFKFAVAYIILLFFYFTLLFTLLF